MRLKLFENYNNKETEYKRLYDEVFDIFADLLDDDLVSIDHDDTYIYVYMNPFLKIDDEEKEFKDIDKLLNLFKPNFTLFEKLELAINRFKLLNEDIIITTFRNSDLIEIVFEY